MEEERITQNVRIEECSSDLTPLERRFVGRITIKRQSSSKDLLLPIVEELREQN